MSLKRSGLGAYCGSNINETLERQQRWNPGFSTKLCQTAGESCQCRCLNLYRPSLSLTLALASLWLIVSALQTLPALSCLERDAERKRENESDFGCCKQKGTQCGVWNLLSPVNVPHQTPLSTCKAGFSPLPFLIGIFCSFGSSQIKITGRKEIMKIWWARGWDSDPGTLKLTWAAPQLFALAHLEGWYRLIKISSRFYEKSGRLHFGWTERQTDMSGQSEGWCVRSCLPLRRLTSEFQSTKSIQKRSTVLRKWWQTERKTDSHFLCWHGHKIITF